MFAAVCGFDTIFVDLEHCATLLETAAMIGVVALQEGVAPIARVSTTSSFATSFSLALLAMRPLNMASPFPSIWPDMLILRSTMI